MNDKFEEKLNEKDSVESDQVRNPRGSESREVT